MSSKNFQKTPKLSKNSLFHVELSKLYILSKSIVKENFLLFRKIVKTPDVRESFDWDAKFFKIVVSFKKDGSV